MGDVLQFNRKERIQEKENLSIREQIQELEEERKMLEASRAKLVEIGHDYFEGTPAEKGMQYINTMQSINNAVLLVRQGISALLSKIKDEEGQDNEKNIE